MNYYVYQYVRENGTPYYIGKGSKRRAWEGHRRANGCDLRPRDRSRIHIIEKNLTEQEAWDLETALVAKHGKHTEGGLLVNVNDGGEGGRTVSSESRRGKKNPRWGIKEDPAVTALRRERSMKTKNSQNYEKYRNAIALMDNGASADSVSEQLGIGRGVCFKLKNRTHGIFTAYPELLQS